MRLHFFFAVEPVCVCVFGFFRRISSICIENILFEWIIFNWCKYTTIINLGWYSAICLRSLSAMVFHWKAVPVPVSIKIIIVMDWRGFEHCEFWFENSYQLEIEDMPDIIADLYLCMYTFNICMPATKMVDDRSVHFAFAHSSQFQHVANQLLH